MDVKKILKDLCGLPGPSGFECEVAQRCNDLLKPFTDSVHLDRLGNVVAYKACGKKNAKTLLLDAHIDEIGLMVTGSEEGFLRFRELGGVDPRMLPDRELLILAEKPLFGVIACLPPHLLSKEDMDKSIQIKDLYIDAGLDAKEAERLVPIGTPAVFANNFTELSPGVLSSKAFDDRACFAVLLYALELLQGVKLSVDLAVMASVQEELGTRGAHAGVFAVNPDYCIAVDVTHASTPDSPKGRAYDLGGGPAIGLGPNIDRRMGERLIELAKENKIKYQLEVMEGNSGTNAWPIQVSREGVKTAVVSVPLRYMHSPAETLDISDIESSARLIAEFAKSLGRGAYDD